MSMSIRQPAFLTPMIAALLQVSILNAQTTSPLDLLKEAAAPGERIAYGSGAQQFGELRVPDGQASHPLAILVHGGCWRAQLGKLPAAATSLELLRPLSVAVVEELLGGGPDTLPERYREASAAGLLPLGTKQELLIADKASEPWIESIKAYGEAAKKAGDPVTVTMLQNSGHFDGLNPNAPAWSTVLASIRSIIGTTRTMPHLVLLAKLTAT
jgi:acetyl esterase/lipase